MKPGWKTSEFWLSLAAQAVGAALASGAVPTDGPWLKLIGGVGMFLAALGYGHGRAMVKASDTSARELSLRVPPAP